MTRGIPGRGSKLLPHLLLCIPLALFPLSLDAQVNSWLKSGSGNWEEDQWSLGKLPGAGQSVLITNAGWKAVAIAPNTQNSPDSLSVHSVTLASPVDSYNVLLFNYPGQAVPLTTRFFSVSSNTAVTMLNGALRLNGGQGEGMSVGGEFNQEAASTVLGSQMDIGYIGPGVYNLRSGNVWLQHVWIGGSYGGRMIQTGGTNAADIVHLERGGEYSLLDGDFNVTEVYFGSLITTSGGLFRQQGGRINTGLNVYAGTYRLEGGYLYGAVTVPPSDGISSSGGGGTMIQTGGTNLASLQIGYLAGKGTYVLSNGISQAPGMLVGARGQVQQWGGSQTIAGPLTTSSDWVDRQLRGYGNYTLNGGSLSAAAMQLDGFYFQNGGTAAVAGDIVVSSAYGDALLVINGGELRSHATSVTSYRSGGYRQTGGRHIIATQLTVWRLFQEPWYAGCILGGGELLVPSIVLTPGATFTRTGGVLSASSLLTITNGGLYIGGGRQQFGRLSLQAAPGPQTNSTIYLPFNNDVTVLTFENSSQVPWSSGATLTIVNWKGSWTGGGAHRVFFGSNSAGLSQPQIAQILFQDPLGLAPGLHRARILETGEIVPDAVPPTGWIPPNLSGIRQSDGTMLITVQGQPSATYGIDISSNLLDWIRWTNVSAPQGSASVTDLGAPNVPRRFYRALLVP